MIDMVPLLKIMPVFAIALIIPGPDFMLVSSLSLSRGRLAGILGAAGIALGTSVYALFCMFGIAIVLVKIQGLITVIRLCGGSYLLYLGFRLWKGSLKSARKEQSPAIVRQARNPFVAGFLTNITNPKAMAFFTSIFALTLTPNTNAPTQAAIVVVTFIMAFGWFGIVALGLSAPAVRKVYIRWSQWIDRAAGTFLAFFGLKLMFSGQK